jgi:hypothetical protein
MRIKLEIACTVSRSDSFGLAAAWLTTAATSHRLHLSQIDAVIANA